MSLCVCCINTENNQTSRVQGFHRANNLQRALEFHLKNANCCAGEEGGEKEKLPGRKQGQFERVIDLLRLSAHNILFLLELIQGVRVLFRSFDVKLLER